jgi:hypothetical protein
MKITYEEVVAELECSRNETERRLHFSALLARAGEVPADDFIIVGGSAIEIYTRGEYTSGGIDIVVSPRWDLTKTLRGWRFSKQRRLWINESLRIVVDLVAYPYTYDQSKTQVLVTPHGSVRIAAVEDLLIKRLLSAKYWKRAGHLEHAKMLAVLYRDRMDWGYVEGLATQFEVADVLSDLRKALSGV